MENYIQISNKLECPVCYSILTINLKQKTQSSPIFQKQKTIIERINLLNWRSSTKIEALMEELNKMKEKDSSLKCLIFSQFVNFLDLIEWRLKIAGFGCVKLDGRMNSIQKNKSIEQFNNNPDITIFLISLKAGGIALNLTIASYCFLLDPW